MALVTQAVNATQLYVPYERPPQNQTLWSAIPRGLFSLVQSAVVLTTKPINDDFVLNISGTLPPNYGYVLESLHFSLAQNVAADWADTCLLNIQNFFRAEGGNGMNANIISATAVADRASTTRAITRTETSTPYPTAPMVAPEGSSGVLTVFSAYNDQNPASVVGTFNYWLSFWQFDLEQIRKYPINSPLPVQAR